MPIRNLRRSLLPIVSIAPLIALILFGVDRFIGRVSFKIHIPKSSFYISEPVPVHFVWQNDARFPVNVHSWCASSNPMGWHDSPEEAPDLAVSVVFRDTEELEAQGIGPFMRPWVLPLQPCGRRLERVLDLQAVYDISRPGQYSVRAVFEPVARVKKDGFWATWVAKRSGSSAETRFEVQVWTEDAVEPIRQRALAGDPGAVRLLGAYKDAGAIPILRRVLATGDRGLRTEAARALAAIGTPDAIDAIGDAALHETYHFLKIEMAHSLMEMEPSHATPWLEAMLQDTVVAYVVEEDGRLLRDYWLRRIVSNHLREAGREVDVVLEQVIDDQL